MKIFKNDHGVLYYNWLYQPNTSDMMFEVSKSVAHFFMSLKNTDQTVILDISLQAGGAKTQSSFYLSPCLQGVRRCNFLSISFFSNYLLINVR